MGSAKEVRLRLEKLLEQLVNQVEHPRHGSDSSTVPGQLPDQRYQVQRIHREEHDIQRDMHDFKEYD